MKRIFGFLLALLAVVTFAVPIAHAAEGQTVLLSKQGQLSEILAKTAEEVVAFDYENQILRDTEIKDYNQNQTQNCWSARKCQGKILNHKDRHNCKLSGGKSWQDQFGQCYPV
ncbi:hypothetical protein [Moorena sp. SIO4G3]|uniref:hypothetical protein n=1 Tax=Moorena sp. SIO4G3 TaxID=2607821 RepID=UPI00142C13FB|nr:hypothetical protein [Moorena sp. SIO4G3]NEO80988.1 hypothetical protein [Moorena sp. SIO4G3]